jgi:hypothetical protein
MSEEAQVGRRLDAIAALVEDLFILQALKEGVPGGAVRGLLGVDMNRVTQISKMLKRARNRGA